MSVCPLNLPIRRTTTTMGIDGLWTVSHSCSFYCTRSRLMDISRLLHLLQVDVHLMSLLLLRGFAHALQVTRRSSCALDLMRGK